MLSADDIHGRIEKLRTPLDSEIKFEEVNLNKKSGKTVVRFRSEEPTEKMKTALKKIEESAEMRRLDANKSVKISDIPKRVTKASIKEDLFVSEQLRCKRISSGKPVQGRAESAPPEVFQMSRLWASSLLQGNTHLHKRSGLQRVRW